MEPNKKLRVLVVDDNFDFQHALYLWASDEERVDLLSALNVRDAINGFDELVRRGLDVVAVDGQIPGALNSVDFMKAVKKSGYLKGKGLAIAISTEPTANQVLRNEGCHLECDKSDLHTVLGKLVRLGS